MPTIYRFSQWRQAPALIALLALSLLATACDVGGPPATPPTSHGGPVRDQGSLIDNLRAAGLSVNPIDKVEQPFLSIKGDSVQVGSQKIEVFEYADGKAAESDASKIPPDANIPAISILWSAQPHFYRAERIIVLYVGADPTTLAALEAAMGKPFAVGPNVPAQVTPMP